MAKRKSTKVIELERQVDMLTDALSDRAKETMKYAGAAKDLEARLTGSQRANQSTVSELRDQISFLEGKLVAYREVMGFQREGEWDDGSRSGQGRTRACDDAIVGLVGKGEVRPGDFVVRAPVGGEGH